MKQVSTYPLRLPRALKEAVTRLTKREGTSINQFVVAAVAEKLSALETEAFFSERHKRADLKEFKRILTRSGGESPRSGDEVDEELRSTE